MNYQGKVKDTKKIDIVNKLNEKLIMLVKEYREYYNELIKGVEVKNERNESISKGTRRNS